MNDDFTVFYVLTPKAAWEEAANEADRTKIRFVHKLSAWKQVEGGRQAAGISEETSALIVSLLVNTFCDRTLSAPTIASLKQYYVPEVLLPILFLYT